MKFLKYTFACTALLFAGSVLAQSVDELNAPFKMMFAIKNIPIVVPTVVEVPLSGLSFERKGSLVFEKGSKLYLPSYFNEVYVVSPEPLRINSVGVENPVVLIDDDTDTGIDYELDGTGSGRASITLQSEKPITTSQITLELDENVSLPNFVEVIATRTNGEQVVVVGQKQMTSRVINFPEIIATAFTINLRYSQLLRINEIHLTQSEAEKTVVRSIRFLAQPGEEYSVYYNPDRTYKVKTTESGNLTDDEEVFVLKGLRSVKNDTYIQADIDEDGVLDVNDNCVDVANTDQQDLDQNRTGDACDDFDRDGVLNTEDNCTSYPNSNQADEDGDDIGDACDDVENRITERYVWVPWVGMGTAFLVLIGLFVLVASKPRSAALPENDSNSM